MTAAQRPKSTLRSIGAVFAGFVAIVILSNGTDAVLHSTGVFPPFGQPMSAELFALALAYRIVYAIATSWLVARLAPERPMGHALAFGIVGVVFTLIATVATWNRGPEFGPRWYPLALIAVSIPCAYLGGKVYQLRQVSSGYTT